MIARLRGLLIEKQPNAVVIEAGGVGYAAMVPISAYTELPDLGAEVVLHVHTHVREDALSLFGFLTKREKELFEKLITVNGVGPRLAITILSGLPTAELFDSIRSGDAQRLTRIPGIGRKTGERIILELREKLGPIESPEGAARGPASALESDVVSAMMNLGCAREAAERAVAKARGEGVEEFEALFRKALDLVRR